MNIKFLSFLTLGVVMCACSDSDAPEQTNDSKLLEEAVNEYVTNTVTTTYANLADRAIELAEVCGQMPTATPAQLQQLIAKACQQWKESRVHWELSEAFLYGAAADYNIDPHIDSWPLDYDLLDQTLRTPSMMAKLAENDQDAIASLGYSLLGFHALEYMIFANGRERDGSTLTPEMLIYTAAVARDLRNQSILLEAAWSVDGVSDKKQAILDEADINPSANYGVYMTCAGQPGSIYKSYHAAAQQIVQGCIDIADEVANTKIFSAYSSADLDYIESPHSKNSQTDFADNIRSIRNAYCGTTAQAPSLSKYMKQVDPKLDQQAIDAIDQSLSSILDAKGPFADNLQDPSWGEAIKATNALRDILQEIMNKL